MQTKAKKGRGLPGKAAMHSPPEKSAQRNEKRLLFKYWQNPASNCFYLISSHVNNYPV
jgi:hypothetical protein